MWNQAFIIIIGILISFTFLTPSQSIGASQAEITWQLVVISSEPACSTYHYYMVQKYNEISQEYLNLYKIAHGNYQPECYTDIEFAKEYQKPSDLDLLILVFDKDKGMADLHAHNTGGVYIHQGNDLSRNHTIIVCDCPNFKYSDPVWIFSHELSHFVLNYLGFELDVVEDEIHGLDYKFDSCVEGTYDNLCSTVKTKVSTSRSNWTVMIPYEPAIGIEPSPRLIENVSLDSPYQTMVIMEITNWWIDKEISDENYINSLKILSGKEGNKKIISQGIFESSALLILAEPPNEIHNSTLSKETTLKLTEDFLELNDSIVENMTNFSASDEKIFLEWLETKAISWRTNQIDDDEFISEIEWILDTPKVDLYQNYLDGLSIDELISKAIESEKARKYRNAISYYDRAILESFDSNENEIKALIGKASALNVLGQYEDALEYFDSALDIEPDNTNLLKKKAFTLAQLGELEEAKEYFEIAIQMELE